MKKTIISMVAVALTMMSGTAFATVDVPTLGVGDQYVTTEELRLSAELLGPNGFIQINMDATYQVVGETTITKDKFGGASFDVWELSATGTLEGTGDVSITDPIPISGPARVTGGTYEAKIYVDKTTFATVKKTRSMSGTAEYQLPTGAWFPIGDLVINENEEYSPSLPEMPFPLTDGGGGGPVAVEIAAFGDISAAGLISTDIDEVITVNPSWTIGKEMIEVAGTQYDTYLVTHTDTATGLTLTNNYSCEANFSLKYEITNLPLGETGTIDYLRVNVVEFQVAAGSCDGPVSGDPTLSISSNADTYGPGDPITWSFGIDNSAGTSALNGNVFLAVDIAGAFYFYNYETFAFVANPGITFTPATIAAGENFSRAFLEAPTGFDSLGGLSLTWFVAWQKDTGDFLADIPGVTTTHN